MEQRDVRKFWINWFLGGFGIALGGFGIGMIVGGAWMHFWPVKITVISATGALLVTISVATLGKSSTYITKLTQRRKQPAEFISDDQLVD
jgi:hypothetical protein